MLILHVLCGLSLSHPYIVRIKQLAEQQQHPTVIVGIVGGSGSGKTWVADRLSEILGADAARLTLDDFYRDRSHLSAARRARLNFDHPRAIDWQAFESALDDLAAGRDTTIPCYDFASHCRSGKPKAVPAKPVVLVDGLWLFRCASVRRLLALRIFVECSPRERLERRLQRDTVSRGRTAASVREQFRTAVEPMHKRFVEPQRRWANLVLGEDEPATVIRRVASQIDQLREQRMR